MYVSINLVGMLVRGLVLVADVENQLSKMDDKLKEITSQFYDPKQERKTNVTALVLIVVYLVILFHFWNIGVAVVAIMLMIARIPNLLWEIKYGRNKMNEMPRIYFLTTLFTIATLPMLWFALH